MSLQHWKKLGQRTLLKHPRLTVYEDDVEMADGTPSTYIHLGSQRKITSAFLIVIRKDKKILLQKELSYPTGEFLWQLPGGGVKSGEEIEAAANRELMEEVGLRAGSIKILGKYYTHSKRSANMQCIAVARDLEEAALPADKEEFFEHEWFTEAEIEAMIRSGEFTNAHALAGWSVYRAQKV